MDWDEEFTSLHGACRISVPDRTAWRGQLHWQRSSAYSVAFCSGDDEVVTRDRRHIRADTRGAYELLVPISGSAWMEQGPSTGPLQPGHMAVCDVDRPFTFAHRADFRSIAFIMPGQDVSLRSRAAVREPCLLDGAHGLGRLVRQLVIALQEERDQLSEAAFDVACGQLLDLVCLAAEGDVAAAPAGQRATVEAGIRRYVREHVCDDDLDVTAIARALGWSTRYVQQVLQAAGTTPRELIRTERLNLARTRLAGAGWATTSIAQIAHSCGFPSHAAFSTAFRAQFGMTPREARYSPDQPASDGLK